MGAIFVADDGSHGNLAIREQPSLLILFGQLRIEPFKNSLTNAAEMSQPDRCRQNENVGRKHLLSDVRPVVAVTHVSLDPRLHIVINHSHQ